MTGRITTRFALILTTTLLAGAILSGCSDDEANADAGTNATTGTGTNATTDTGTDATTEAPTDAGTNATAEAQLQQMVTNATCVTNDDCCAVVDSCWPQWWVVGSGDYAAAQTLADQAAEPVDGCWPCSWPAPALVCDDGQCAAAYGENSMDWEYSGLDRQNHCGNGGRNVESLISGTDEASLKWTTHWTCQ